jgi:LysM repeat protein
MEQRTAAWTIPVLLSCGLVLAACGDNPEPVVRAPAPAQAPVANQIYIVVQRGQTLDALADKFRVPKAEIIASNNLKPPYALKPGAVLKIPAPPPELPGEGQAEEKPADRPAPARPAPAVRKPDRAAAAQPAEPDAAPARPKRPKPTGKPKAPEVIPLD